MSSNAGSHRHGSLLTDDDHAPATAKRKPREDSGAGGIPAWAQALVIAAALGIAGLTVWNLSSGGDALEASSRDRVVIDAVSGEVIKNFRVPDGATIPYVNSKTGNNTLWPAEECYWTADGGAKTEPTYVLLEEYKGNAGPTTCPDCSRTVRQHNPLPPIEVLMQLADTP
ncbi:MAG: hypothetical protein AAF297_00620 [Planctomycetota bacterium]